MRKTLLIALMTGSLALGAVATNATEAKGMEYGEGKILTDKIISKEVIESGRPQQDEKNPFDFLKEGEEGKQEKKYDLIKGGQEPL